MPEYIENNIAKFAHILRHLGLRVSTAEVIDAVKALEMVDMIDARQTKTALGATLAKDPQAKILFNLAFDSFFVPPEKKNARHEAHLEAEEKKAKMIEASHEDLSYSMEAYGEEENSQEMQVELDPEDRATYAQLPEDIKQKFKNYLNKNFQKNPINPSKSLVDNLVKSYLNYWQRYLKDKELLKNPPLEVQMTGEEAIDEVLEEIVSSLKDENQLLYEDMKNIGDKDIPSMSRLIRRLARQLATRISRRYRKSSKKQFIDLRRSIRHNIRFGGTMLYLKYRRRRVQKPKIVLICDVSGSMAKYAGFVLQFIYSLASAVENIECFVFSEDVERVTPYFAEKKPFEQIMADIINLSKAWGKGTDIGRALRLIRQEYRNLLTRDTFVIMVSDTKSVAIEKAGLELASLREKVKELIWLNTVPRQDWRATPSVNVFKKYSSMYECSNLSHLDKIMRTQFGH